MVKFRIGFTIESETLFGLVAKMLPIDDLHIEELMERPQLKQSQIEKLISKNLPQMLPVKSSSKPIEHFKHPSGKPIKDFVMEYLTKQPSHTGRWKEINRYITSLGFGKSSLNNSLKHLIESKSIRREKDGIYRVIQK